MKLGEMDEWLREWRQLVYPLRLEHGFRIVGAWVNRGEDGFVWIVGHWISRRPIAPTTPRPSAAMDPDPARHLDEAQTLALEPVVRDG